MSDRKPLMPKATAVWLVENTSLTFEQIAEFCGLHQLEVKGIADGDVAQGIKGLDPIANGQLSRDEIMRGEKIASRHLKLSEPKVALPAPPTNKKGHRYTPVSRRHVRPHAVLWLLRNHPELKDSQIVRLVGTTKPTIQQVRDRSHWDMTNLVPQDPVTLGLCSQIDLDAEVKKSARRVERVGRGLPEGEDGAEDTLLPTEETTGAQPYASIVVPKEEEKREETAAEEEARVFAKLKELSAAKDEDEAVDTGEKDEE